MSSDNNIKHFTALDIEKYHKGLLSATDMYAMEKAAMDDPFLADALEGYSISRVNVNADITELQERLSNRVGTAKVIPLSAGSRNRNFNLLRAAVILVFIAGAGLLIYQFGFNNEKKEIAQAKQVENKPDTATIDNLTGAGKDSSSSPISASENSTATTTVQPPSKIAGNLEQPVKVTNESKPVHEEDKVASTELGLVTADDAEEEPVRKANVSPVTMAPRGVEEKKANIGIIVPKNEDGKNVAKDSKQPTKETVKEDESRDQATMNRAAGQSRRADNYQQENSNSFRGRVTDRENVGVPFANVTNIKDNDAGTYTDAKGYFNLNYPDSVLNVQVRSVGFQNTNAQLRNNLPTNKVVLNDDRGTLSEVVVNRQKINSAQRNTGNNTKSEGPEPADGWDNYDAYLINNLQTPPDFKSKQTQGIVEVSFEVNKNGEPINLKIEKSLCKSCDQEAIRLIKEGPKWKRKTKKGRTRVKVAF